MASSPISPAQDRAPGFNSPLSMALIAARAGRLGVTGPSPGSAVSRQIACANRPSPSTPTASTLMAPRSDPSAANGSASLVKAPARGRADRPVRPTPIDNSHVSPCSRAGESPARNRASWRGEKRAWSRSRSGVSQSETTRRPARPKSLRCSPLQPLRSRHRPSSNTRTGRPSQLRIACMTDSPRGALAPGLIAASTVTTSRQPAVI